MKITDVKIKKIEGESRVKAVAAVTFDDCFAVHGINVIDGQKGMFIAMPSRKISDSVFLDIVHPTNSETRKMIEEAKQDAERIKKDALIEAKDESIKQKEEADKEIKQRNL